MPIAKDIALIFLSLEALVLAFIPMVLIAGLAYGVFRLHRWTRSSLQLAQGYVQRAHDVVDEWSEKIARPFIAVHATASQVEAILDKVTKTFITRRSR
jgi:hypothetical protein